jgi:acyl-CoA thioesterase
MSATTTHALDEAIALAETAPGRYTARTHPAYANAVGPFGGVTAALLLNAALKHPQALGEPISQTVHFAAPITDEPLQIDANPVRTNRSTQHWIVQAFQHGLLVAMCTAVFAVRRDTWSAVDARFPGNLPPPDQLSPLQWSKQPPFTHCYDLRYISGMVSLDQAMRDGPQEQPHAESSLWVRDEPPRALDFASLASLCDVFFPRVFVRRQRWTPIGTVTMTSYFHADSQTLAQIGSAHVLGCARAQVYQNGFFDQSAELWSADGKLLATTHQMVYFKE